MIPKLLIQRSPISYPHNWGSPMLPREDLLIKFMWFKGVGLRAAGSGMQFRGSLSAPCQSSRSFMELMVPLYASPVCGPQL